MPTSQMFFATVKSAGGPPPFEQLYTTPGNGSSVTLPGPGTYKAFLCGGGGSSPGRGGPGGFFRFDITFPDATTTLQIGVGAFINNQSTSYPMRGGHGFTDYTGNTYGSPHRAGGGGGSYLKITSGGGSLVNHNNYIAVVGGGGGGAVHGYSANIGGIGYGNGGPAYNSDWQGVGNGGGGGYLASHTGAGGGPESSGHSGGSANSSGKMNGAYATSTDYHGGAGGGGYGAGAAGAAGHSNNGNNGANGGYISGLSVGSSSGYVRIRPGGGGGGGSHGNACGGNGGGGGALLFVDYTPNWNQSSDLIAYNNTNNKSATAWPCYSDLPSNIQSQVSSKGGEMQDGFVYITNI